MDLVKMYGIALMVFLLFDSIWLGSISTKLYKQEIGHLMAKNPNLIVAGIFYILFLIGLVYFVINPAITKESVKYAIVAGAIFGLMTYATYDLTNLATLKKWSVKITMIDMAWGTFLSSIVSMSTYYIYMWIK